MPRKTQTSAQPDTEPTEKRPRRTVKKAPEADLELAATAEAAADTKETPKRRSSPKVATNPKGQRTARSKSSPKADPEPSAEFDDIPVAVFRKRADVPAKKGRPEPAAPIVEVAAEPAPAPKGASRKRSKSDDDLPVPLWRPRQRPAAARPEASNGKVAGRRSRRRRGESAEDEITAAAALEPSARKPDRRERPAKGERASSTSSQRRGHAPPDEEPILLPEPLPAAPPKPIIPIPADAPQVVVRNGVPAIVRQGRIYPPISFFGSAPDERRAQTVLDEIRLAAESGIHLHVHLVELEVDPAAVATAVGFAGYMLRKTLELDSEAQVLFRVVFLSPEGWSRQFPNAAFHDESGRLSEPSLCDDDYWSVARQCLADFVRSLRTLPENGHILGLHLERGEWFFADGVGYDTSKAAVGKFRDWARTRYLNDFVALRAAWFDSGADFDNLTIPAYHHPSDEGEKFVRANRKERRWVDYHLFLSDSTVARIGDLAYAAKEASEGYFLLGVSYGYTFEWSHPASGHLSLGKLLRTPEIDFIAGPPSYRSREPGGAAPFPSPIDSYALNGKIYISEEDFKTAIGEWKEPDDFNPVIRTPQALESVHWRGAGSALAHAAGVCWMDLWGNGWLKTSTIWQRGEQIRRAMTLRLGTPLSDPDVAVFIDERALAYLVDQASFALLVQNVRESVLRAGVSAGFYLLSDLTHREKFPASRVYIFLNAWDIRSDLRAAIKSRLQQDGKLLFWLYSAGYFDSGRESLERAREVTGVALKPQPFHSRAGTTILNRKHPLCEAFPDRGTIGGGKLDPTYFAIPEEATVLGEYSQTGLPSFVTREFNHGPASEHWTTVFMGEPVVTPALVRALCQQAGGHVWNYQDDVVHVRPPFLTVHCSGSGPRAITLPEKWSAYSLLSESWVASDSSSLRFNALDGSTHLFLVGLQADIENILSMNPDELLKISEIPAREEDTVRFDAISFDVPIMKLGEWMEGGTLDDVSEDWLLHPSVSDIESEIEEEPAEEPVGRRRRRNRGRGERSRSGGATAVSDDDLGLGVMFRKRE